MLIILYKNEYDTNISELWYKYVTKRYNYYTNMTNMSQLWYKYVTKRYNYDTNMTDI